MGIGTIFLSSAAGAGIAALKRLYREQRARAAAGEGPPVVPGTPTLRCIGNRGPALDIVRSVIGPAEGDGTESLDAVVIDGRTGPSASHIMLWEALEPDARLAVLVFDGLLPQQELESALALTSRALSVPPDGVAVLLYDSSPASPASPAAPALSPDVWADDLADKLAELLPAESISALAASRPVIAEELMRSLRRRVDIANGIRTAILPAEAATSLNSLDSTALAMDIHRASGGKGLLYPLTEVIVNSAVTTVVGHFGFGGRTIGKRLARGLLSAAATELLARGFERNARRTSAESRGMEAE